MGSPKGAKPPRNKKRSKLFFELDDRVHKKIAVNRAADLLHAWDFERKQQVTYNYTLALKRMKPVFRTGDVAWMLGRSRHKMKKYIWSGDVPAPVKSTMPGATREGMYLWKESDIMGLLAHLSTVHYGRPRKDGIVKPLRGLPSPRELRAMIHEDNIMYVKQGDHFVPTWRAKEI